MESRTEIARVPMQLTSGCLVASIQLDLTTELLRQFQHDLLDRIKTTGVSGVILDVSGVQIMDLDDFELLRRSMAMASIMGARPVLVGLRPGIVASLIDLDANVSGVEAAVDLDDALRCLQSPDDDGAPTPDDVTITADSDTGGTEDSNEGTDRSDSNRL